MVKLSNGNWMRTAPLKICMSKPATPTLRLRSVMQVIEAAKHRGLDGVAITDHHTLQGRR